MGLLENAISEELGAAPPLSSPLPPRSKVQEKNKIIAAAVGATLTSLTMTPFDVIKTRLQTQAPPEPLFMPSAHLPPPSSSARGSTSPWPPPVASTSTAALPNTSPSYRPLSTAPLSTSTAASNAVTCCRPTYFSSNVDQSLLCRFDPRLSTSSLPASGSHTTSPAGPASLRHQPSSSAFVHHLAPLSHQHTPTPSPLVASPSGAAASCIHPTPSAATLSFPSLSQPSASRHLTGFWDAVSKISRHEGIAAMWRGTGPALAMSVPGQVVYMVGYDWGRRTAFEEAPSWAYTTSWTGRRELSASYLTLVPLVAGSLSRTLVACLTSPLELVRTRLQSSTTGTTIPIIYRSLRAEGLASAWRGLPPTLWRDVPFSGIYWAGYEGIKRTLTGGKGMGEGWEGSGVWEEFGVAFVSGAGSGMIAATFTNPFDVVKTRRQALDSSALSAEAIAAGEKPPVQLTKTFPILMDIYHKEGMAGLMRGLTPRLAKVGPACGLMIASYEGLSLLLDQPR